MTESTQTQLFLSRQLIKRFQQAGEVVIFNPFEGIKTASLTVTYSNKWKYRFKVITKMNTKSESEIYIPTSINSWTVYRGVEYVPEELMSTYRKLKNLTTFTQEDRHQIEEYGTSQKIFDEMYKIEYW